MKDSELEKNMLTMQILPVQLVFFLLILDDYLAKMMEFRYRCLVFFQFENEPGMSKITKYVYLKSTTVLYVTSSDLGLSQPQVGSTPSLLCSVQDNFWKTFCTGRTTTP
jgi:hypothetical protein